MIPDWSFHQHHHLSPSNKAAAVAFVLLDCWDGLMSLGNASAALQSGCRARLQRLLRATFSAEQWEVSLFVCYPQVGIDCLVVHLAGHRTTHRLPFVGLGVDVFLILQTDLLAFCLRTIQSFFARHLGG